MQNNIVPLSHASRASKSIAYGHGGLVQVFVGCERDYQELREGFERILAYRPTHNFMLLKLESGDCEYVDCGPATRQVEAGGMFADAARQLSMF